jgi:hypothetical protein
MRSLVVAFAGALVAVPALAAGPQITPCSVALWVTDQDPNGLNVRTSPGGGIVTALRAKSRNVQVNVTGAAGAWAQINAATLYQTGSQTTLFEGAGFVAFSKLGLAGGLGDGARVLAEPAEGARQLFAYHWSGESKAPPIDVLGCSGAYLKLRVNGVVGWTNDI